MGDARTKRGLTLIEMVTAVSLFAMVSVALMKNLGRETRALQSYASQSFKETQACGMLDRVTSELDYAQAVMPVAWAGPAIGAGIAGGILVDTTSEFPPDGVLLLQPGTGGEERIGYSSLDPFNLSFEGLERGVACGDIRNHPGGTLVRWAHSAQAIPEQAAPPVEFYDGVSMEPSGPVFYRGDGTGFVFRTPVDPAGNGNFFDIGGNVQWGANVAGVPLTSGYFCFYFAPATVVNEAQLDLDVNQDGDLEDLFDCGSIRMRAWDSANPNDDATDVALCPAVVLQEVCEWGSDLDGDGWEDPIFLWHPDISKLHIRVLVLTENSSRAVRARFYERSAFLPNGGAN